MVIVWFGGPDRNEVIPSILRPYISGTASTDANQTYNSNK